MTIKDVTTNANSNWTEGNGPDSDVVISSRIRLARNFMDIPFPHLLTEQSANQILEGVKEAVANKDVEGKDNKLEFIPLKELSSIDRQILVEKHLVSPQFVQNPLNKAVVISKDEDVSIMVNEEDHLRIQCLFSGLQLEEAWSVANKSDDLLEKSIDFAFSEEKGYLTACPTNIGTGLRASVMLHLPALELNKQIGPILETIGKLGLVVRGFYGEGTQAVGNLFQISNQVTLGPSETEIISNLEGITKQIIAQERQVRNNFYKENKYYMEDKIYRAYGLLKNVRIISSDETIHLLSDVRLGVDMGILKDVSVKTINELMILTRPAFLQKITDAELKSMERDIKRAELVRNKLE